MPLAIFGDLCIERMMNLLKTRPFQAKLARFRPQFFKKADFSLFRKVGLVWHMWQLWLWVVDNHLIDLMALPHVVGLFWSPHQHSEV